jgi:hypothetical protein
MGTSSTLGEVLFLLVGRDQKGKHWWAPKWRGGGLGKLIINIKHQSTSILPEKPAAGTFFLCEKGQDYGKTLDQ